MSWGWFLYLAAWALAVDGIRRPASDWAMADRRRPVWVGLLAILGVVGIVLYMIGVFPRLLSAAREPRSPFART